ncbi:hypothetical protein CA51_41560 [Rosistilla oblonga]|nr:hypothetical protein CA51_41560 [Rosistilla oblonga]
MVAARFNVALWELRAGQHDLLARKHLTDSATIAAVDVNAVLAVRERFPGLQIPTSTWSMTFPNLLLLIDVLDTYRPRNVVEFGSGISTLCVASWLKEAGRGNLLSVDHDPEWAEITTRHLGKRSCDAIANVIVTPLNEQSYFGKKVNWYDLESHLSSIGGDVDLVIVDGPPNGSKGAGYARIPAIEALAGKLAPDAIIVLDDAAREGETKIFEAWEERYGILQATRVNTGTGFAVIKLAAAPFSSS